MLDYHILKLHKQMGRPSQVFRPNDVEYYQGLIRGHPGIAAIDHVRYATAGSDWNYGQLIREAQPDIRVHGRLWKMFALGINGNIANYQELMEKLIRRGYHLSTRVDTEVIKHLFSLALKDSSKSEAKPNLFEVSHAVMEQLDGGYSIGLLFGDGDMVFLNDPHGIRPLVYGENEQYCAFASESIGLDPLGITDFQFPPPGSVTIVNGREFKQEIVISGKRKAHCKFEFVYFSDAFSYIFGKSVDEVRRMLGRNLAKSDPLKDYFIASKEEAVVVAMPNTAIPAAEAYAEALGLRTTNGIVKYGQARGFINRQGERIRIMGSSYRAFPGRVGGKIVIVVDDTVVRGETSKGRMKQIKDAGAKEIHFRITSPPIRHPCYYGVDFPTYRELFAQGCQDDRAIERRLAEVLGINSVHYQSLEGLVSATGFNIEELCLACLTGRYPTKWGEKNAATSLLKLNNNI